MKHLLWTLPLLIALMEFAVIQNQKNRIVESQSRVENLLRAEADRTATRIPAAGTPVASTQGSARGASNATTVAAKIITVPNSNPAATLPEADRPIFDRDATFPPRMAVNSYGRLVPVLPPPSDVYEAGGQVEEPTHANVLAKLPASSGDFQH